MPPSRIPPLLVALGAVVVYANALSNGFALDDIMIIVDNATAHDPTDLLRIWLTPYWPGWEGLDRGLYRPLTIFLFSLQWAIGSGSPLPFHVLNVLLHAVVCVLVYRLLHGLTSREGALAGAFIFAVHPVHVEAVANSVGQAEVFSAACVLTAVTVYAERPADGLRMRGQLAIAGLYLAAALTKESAIVLPALLLALDLAQGRLGSESYRAGALRLLVLLGAAATLYLALRFVVLQGSLSGSASATLGFLNDPATRLRTALSVWPEYLRLLAFPIDLSATYDPATIRPQESVTHSVVVGALLLVAVVTCCLLPRAWPGLGLGSAWFLVTILLVSNLVVPIGTVLAERTLYLPSVAVAIWIAFGVARLPELGAPQWTGRAVRAVGVCVALAFAARTLARNPVWRDNEILFATTLEDHPESFRAHWFRALQLQAAGDATNSRRHWEDALGIYSENDALLTGYALFLLSEGELDRADRTVDRALDIRPNAAASIYAKGLIELASDRPDGALGRVRRLQQLGFATLATQLEDRIRAADPGIRP